MGILDLISRLKYGFLLRIVNFILLLGLSPWAQAKTTVAWVFANSALCKTKVCLHGSHSAGTEIMLLSKEKSQTCVAKVGATFKAQYEPGPFDAAEVTVPKSCKLTPEEMFLAVFEKAHAKYKIVAETGLSDEELKKKDKKLKRDALFSKAWKREVFRPEGHRDRVPYTVADYRRLTTEGFEYKHKKDEILQVFRQKFADTSNPGYLFAYYKNNWSIVSSTFSQGLPFVFRLGTRLYLVSKVTCQLACGYIDNEVYEFNGRVFRLIYNNADLST